MPQLPAWLGDTEAIGLQLAALALLSAVILVLADSPLYPVALGIEIIVLLYLLSQPAIRAALGPLSRFVQHPGGTS